MNTIDMSRDPSAPSSLSRRSVVASAAWAVPAIAAAIAVPAASASASNASLAWTASQTALLSLRLLDGGGLVTAQALVTVPTQLTLTNGSGAIAGETATVQIVVGRPAGINIPVGRARGFGVFAYDGTPTPTSSRTTTYQTAFGLEYGFPTTTYTSVQTITIPSNGTLDIPIEFGLAGGSTNVWISALSSYLVTVIVTIGGRTLTATTNISVTAGAGIL